MILRLIQKFSSECCGKVYSSVNQDVIAEYNYKEKIYNKLNKSYQEIVESIKNTLDSSFNKLYYIHLMILIIMYIL